MRGRRVRAHPAGTWLEAMMPKPLSDHERRVLDYIVAYLQTNTYQPSIREIGREFSIKSTKTVSELLQSLANKGWIERDPSRSRGVRLLGLEMRPDTVSLPLFRASDGDGDGVQPYLLDRKLVTAAGAYLLIMEGDHLVEEGIRAGDLLVVEPQAPGALQVGDIVAVRTGQATSIRRCHATAPALVLEPARPGELPLTLSSEQADAVVQGCATTVIRQLRPASEPAAIAVAAQGA
jgi:repressor LexA